MNTNDSNNPSAILDAENMKIDDRVIKKVVASGLVEVDGYLGTANHLMSGITGMFKKNTTEEEDALSGISVSVKDNEADVTLKVITEEGKNIPMIINAIAQNVRKKLHEIGGLNTKDIKVEVVDTMSRAEYQEKYGRKAEKAEATQ